MIIFLQNIKLPYSEIYRSKLLTAPYSLSQLFTSFIAFKSQGIRHMLVMNSNKFTK